MSEAAPTNIVPKLVVVQPNNSKKISDFLKLHKRCHEISSSSTQLKQAGRELAK